MWHEARKQEKMIRGLIVDYRRRAERRKDFYEKIKADPTQFLQLHGRPCKIHLDPAVAAAGEGPAIMMPWQGDSNNMIDRFDVRAHLDFIPEVKAPDIPPEDLSQEERQCNYERYRILAQNAFLGMSEDKFLQQLAIEEQFGVTLEEKEHQKEKLNEKKGTGVAIGYNYNDPTAQPSSFTGLEKKVEQKESDDDSDLEILDVDLSIDVNKMEASQAHELNAVGPLFGMAGCDLFSFLTGDADDAEHQKQLLREEKEKAMFSGRKSRRERRAHRDKKLATRVVSPPSYAAPAEPQRSPTRSPSRTPSPEPGETIEFITSFGGDDDDKPPLPSTKPLYSEKVKQNLKKMALYSEIARKNKARSPIAEIRYSRPIGPRGPNSRSTSRSKSKSSSRSRSRSHNRSRSRSYRKSRSKSISRSSLSSRSKSRDKSRSLDRSRSRGRSKSRSYDSYRRSRSRSRSRNYRSKRSRSLANTNVRNRSRSMSYERGRGKPSVARYYGRRAEDKSSSDLSLDSDTSGSEDPKHKSSVGNKSNTNENQLRSSGSSTKGMSRETLSLKEKLRRKMQAQLSRQLRADKRAEAERQERESRRQARRDEEMRDLAIKLRRKQREMRHKYRRSSDDSDRSRSRSSSRCSPGGARSASRTPSPEPRPPVWETKDTPLKYKPEVPKQPEHSRSRSPSKERRYPVWETAPYRQEGTSYSDNRRKYDEDRSDYYKHDNRIQEAREIAPYRQDGPSYSDNRRKYDEERSDYYKTDSKLQYSENRWESRRRPFGHRGGYRGHSRGGPSWKDDRDEGKGKVKLVDY